MLISALNRKLLRDLTSLKGQLLTIALVVASGVAAFTTTRSSLESLVDAQAQFYADNAFADVFVHLGRAPISVARRLEAIEGVSLVETRIVDQGSMPMASMPEPASATVVSLPERLNTIHLRQGRLPEPHATDEVVINDSFAEAHALEIGDRVPLVVGGVRRELRVVGIGLSPEFVIVINPSDMAMDARKSVVVFMNRAALAAVLGLEGSFNDALIRVDGRAQLAPMLDAVDTILEPYGGRGAIARERQMSHYFLAQELSGLESMSAQVPPLFLLVAAFLLHMVLTRLIQLQRSQVAALKALGYTSREIGLHYLGLATVIVVIGAGLGVAFGGYLANGMVSLYEDYFRFPNLKARLDPATSIIAILVSTLAAALGTYTSVRSILRLAPAEAMRPPAPTVYKKGLLDGAWTHFFFGPSARMILREIQRRPLRLTLSALAISVAVAILVVARFWDDAMTYLADVQMHESQRWDVQVGFAAPRPSGSLGALRHLPGVHRVEGMRGVPVRFRHGHRERTSVIMGYPADGTLQRVLEGDRAYPIPEEGIVLTDYLGELLDVHVGEEIEVDVQEGAHQTIRLRVAGLVAEPFGLQGHMNTRALHEALDEEVAVTSALMTIDPERAIELDARLAGLRDVIGVSHKDRTMALFKEQSAQNIGAFSLVLTLFGVIIAVGVVYNNARVALSMRQRDLASLRVLGFKRSEISSILIGELAVGVLLAIPIGLLFGDAMVHGMTTAADPEQFRFPIIVSTRTYAFATIVTLGSAIASAWLVNRRIRSLDLIGVLKTRE